jgi:succinyl-CoA synthetase beta subunit
MRLLEHEAKSILQEYNIPTPQSEVILPSKDIVSHPPFVLKSQVPVGGRAKAGGVIIINTPDEVAAAVERLFSLPIKDHFPTALLAEEKLSIKSEFYLSILIDRTDQAILFVAHRLGGVEVEENDPVTFLKIVPGDTPDFDSIGQRFADYFELPGQTFALQDMAERLYKAFVENDATLIEINPLVLTNNDELIAGDCKMTVDDAAGFRHQWDFAELPAEANFVTLDSEGTIATIANGAGLAMATVDATSKYGLKPANFLDVGGGANTDTLLDAFNKLTLYPSIKGIIINIFAGITRCDEVARAIVAARKQIDELPPLFIRLAGTGYDDALPILAAENIALLPTLEACLDAAAKEVNRG